MGLCLGEKAELCLHLIFYLLEMGLGPKLGGETRCNMITVQEWSLLSPGTCWSREQNVRAEED